MTVKFRLSIFALVTLAPLGCTDDATSDTSTTTTTSATSTATTDGTETAEASGSDSETDTDTDTGTDTDDDVCYDHSSPPEGLINAPNCGFPSCASDVVYVGNPDECEVQADYDPEVGNCLLQALANGQDTAASLGIRDCPGGQFSWTLKLQLFGDGTVLWHEATFADLASDERATWRMLPDAAYLDACSADTIEQLLDCLSGILEQECQLGEPTCP
ncbi:hypothetical protein [Enhygromyxa salina]|uniref:Uncharacterized protein n=1 Tax=Enhygromyxa salina TaxID=215803 RepID=A0A2S9YFB7_9BACT|nr:hypothetical protein [Enhygromyxa salina]PRQ03808.1 hypothetical protein ENSA7_52750 [Enhygromyxa salina]